MGTTHAAQVSHWSIGEVFPTFRHSNVYRPKADRGIAMDVQSATAAFGAATLVFATIVTIGAKLSRLNAIEARGRPDSRPDTYDYRFGSDHQR